MSQSTEIDLNLHAKQGQAFDSEATEILYGGAAGGGKSHLMRAVAITWAAEILGLQVYIFRRIREDLVKNHMDGPKGFRRLLAPWVLSGFVKILEEEIRFWNDSKIYLCHCKDEKDRFKYLGAEIHVLLIDELTTFTEVIYRFLRGRVRAVGLQDLPPKYQGKFPRILSGSNPGNIGHQWVKRSFVDHGEMVINQMPDVEGGMLRQYIPAKLNDNPSMEKDDPGYRVRLRGLGSEALVKAMEDGDWDVFEGQAFTWNKKRHVISPLRIPPGAPIYMTFDWGFGAPFSIGWWWVDSDGRVYRFFEWYGAKQGPTGYVGLRMTDDDIAEEIKRIEKEDLRLKDTDKIKRYAGPDCFNKKPDYKGGGQGDSTFTTFLSHGLLLRAGDPSRKLKIRQMHRRMKIPEHDLPMLVVYDHCEHFIRTIPPLQFSGKDPEDIDTAMEDHVYDETCHILMARPMPAIPEASEFFDVHHVPSQQALRQILREEPVAPPEPFVNLDNP